MSYYWKYNPDILYTDVETALEDIDLFIGEENYRDTFVDLIANSEYSWAAIRTALNNTVLGQTIVREVEEIAEDTFTHYNLMTDGED